jgi:NAD(P)-dependent dehydrogenase (short-subunit alcohol dehydrogenase family)
VADDRKRLFSDLAREFGKLDIVFANAGISCRTPDGATDEAAFENIVHTNLDGAFFTVNSATPLLNDNASIIFNGSVHNYLGQLSSPTDWLIFSPRRFLWADGANLKNLRRLCFSRLLMIRRTSMRSS